MTSDLLVRNMKENMGKEEKLDGSINGSISSNDDHSNVPDEIETQVERVNQVISEVPEENRNEVIALVMEKSSTFKGPIPPPSWLADYDAVTPGAAERIIKMTENQQNHRINMENKSLDAEIKSEKRGQWMGFCIVVFFLIVACLFVLMGQSVEGLLTLGTVGAAIVGLFIYGRYQINQVVKSKIENDKKPES